VDLFVITTSQANAATLRSLAEGLRKFAALRYVVVALGANKGAVLGWESLKMSWCKMCKTS
jgi:hypothetical protein